MKRAYYAKVAEETDKAFAKIINNFGTEDILNNIFYRERPVINKCDKNFDTKVEVWNIDTVDAGLFLNSEGENPLILNMASERHPGGGWFSGASAQEEAIFRRSNYALHLDNSYMIDRRRVWRYPIPSTGAIYSPGVVIFRDNEENLFEMWKREKCVKLDFIAVPAVRNPKLENGRFKSKDRELAKEKIRTLFSVAIIHGYETLLLSAMGSGAFHNPPQEIAELFREILLEEDYRGKFRRIVFSIIDGRTTGTITTNHRIFRQYFDEHPLCVENKNIVSTEEASSSSSSSSLSSSSNSSEKSNVKWSSLFKKQN